MERSLSLYYIKVAIYSFIYFSAKNGNIMVLNKQETSIATMNANYREKIRKKNQKNAIV